MKFPFLVGRLLFGGFFLYNGIQHFKERKALTQYAGSKHVPMPEVAVVASGVTLVLGGGSLLLGMKPKIGASALAGFLTTISPVMHSFWDIQDPGEKQTQMIQFSKNMALLGAALILMSVPEPWPMSLPVALPDSVRARLGGSSAA